MRRLYRLWEKYRALTGGDRRLIVEALLALIRARFEVLVLPYRLLERRFGVRMAQAPAPEAEQAPELERIRWSIAAVAPRLPFRGMCLEQALAARRMLHRRSIPSTLHVGMDKDGQELLSHAWVSCGDRVLTGDPAVERFLQIASFADAARPDSTQG